MIEKSMFSVALYQEELQLKEGNTAKFDKEIDAKSAKGSWVPDDGKVSIDQIMLVCQCPNGIDVMYADKNGFGCSGMMALNWAKVQLKSRVGDANFCPLCTFSSMNNEMLNNHVRKHYRLGLTCRADGFMTASVSAMKLHMEQEDRYEGKCTGQKKSKGKA